MYSVKAGVGTQPTTLLLAYMGNYLSVMMVYMAQVTPAGNILTYKAIAAKLVQTAVGCTGLILVTPPRNCGSISVFPDWTAEKT